jgi:cellobiose phosphorylase
LGRNSWLSGTASWVYQAATKYILGVKPTYQGIEINPCIPSKWDGYSVKRKYRNATYAIEVKNPGHVNKGVKSVEVDGKKIKGTILPIFMDEKTHKVVVVLG